MSRAIRQFWRDFWIDVLTSIMVTTVLVAYLAGCLLYDGQPLW